MEKADASLDRPGFVRELMSRWLLDEAGAGKTYECLQQAQRLWDTGEPAFFIELAALASTDLR
ncbi:MAG: hypothetical protein P8Y78_15390, partial [Acidihalobacter sp.]